MKNKKNTYERSLSAEEVKQHKIMITKDALALFPKPFKKFALQVGNEKQETAVEAIECHCMGPAQPHEHYWLPVKEASGHPWERGKKATIRKAEQDYTLDLA